MLDSVIIIPARYQSKRLPGKPLIDLNGKPMLQRVWEKCAKAKSPNEIFIATDDIRIKNFCKIQNYNYIMTSKKCLTGTDRIAEAAKTIKAKNFINVQGDEPLILPSDIKKMILASSKYNYVLNAMCEVKNEKEYRSSHVPKLTVDNDNFLMYMSRSPIPGNKDNKFEYCLKQVCIYSFPRNLLLKFSKVKKKSFFEFMEDIEILRFLEKGIKVKMIKVSNSSIGVDTMKDVHKVRKLIK